jgi:hypothetical protein
MVARLVGSPLVADVKTAERKLAVIRMRPEQQVARRFINAQAKTARVLNLEDEPTLTGADLAFGRLLRLIADASTTAQLEADARSDRWRDAIIDGASTGHPSPFGLFLTPMVLRAPHGHDPTGQLTDALERAYVQETGNPLELSSDVTEWVAGFLVAGSARLRELGAPAPLPLEPPR